jgi:hypothetical protein
MKALYEMFLVTCESSFLPMQHTRMRAPRRRSRRVGLAVVLLAFVTATSASAIAGQKLYVGTSSGIYVIDVESLEPTAHIPTPQGVPWDLALSPDGATLYVTHNYNPGYMSAIDTATDTIVDTFLTGGADSRGEIGITPDGQYAYVGHMGGHVVTVIELATRTVVDSIDVYRPAYGTIVSPDGTRVYVHDYKPPYPITDPDRQQENTAIRVIDTSTNTVVESWPVPNSRDLKMQGEYLYALGGTMCTGTEWCGSKVYKYDLNTGELFHPYSRYRFNPQSWPRIGVGSGEPPSHYYVGGPLVMLPEYEWVQTTVSGVGGDPWCNNDILVAEEISRVFCTGQFAPGVWWMDEGGTPCPSPMAGSCASLISLDVPAGALALGPVANAKPTADAGPDQSIHAGNTVTLDGSASFDDNTPSEDLGYAWSFFSIPDGSSAVLLESDTPMPMFEADRPGTYQVQLIVTDDGGLDSDPDEVLISSENIAPTADAGEHFGGITGQIAHFDGTASTDPDGDLLQFTWGLSQTPPGSGALLSGADTPTPWLTPDREGTYVAELVVSDGFEPSDPDSVTLTVITGADFAETKTMEALSTLGDLPPGAVTNRGNQRALSNFLSQAINALQIEDLEEARHKLVQAISRTDGCVLDGAPHGPGPSRDWITNCEPQLLIYSLLQEALDAITA